MKSYEEMAENVLLRRNQYVARQRKRVKKMCSAAMLACLCLIVFSGIGVWNSSILRAPGTSADDSSDKVNPILPEQEDAPLSGIQNLSQQKENMSQAGTDDTLRPDADDSYAPETDSRDNENLELPVSTSSEETAADEHGEVYTEAPRTDQLTGDAAALFCGSYTEENGAFVVVLTQDTPQSRAVVCRELGFNENNVTFRTGIYTLAYLTQLQEKISNAMINQELPFVISSAVMETSNRILVTVTTQEESSLALLKSLDTVGGAIEIEYVESGSSSIQNLLESIEESTPRSEEKTGD
ncbi:MAG: hypothetical protein HDR26_06215 [Lachnospiraceae bacterium]|nr:hypothetical protein [Lachnospiraceae bacterium]